MNYDCSVPPINGEKCMIQLPYQHVLDGVDYDAMMIIITMLCPTIMICLVVTNYLIQH